ncbi:hypothetical protein KFK09_021750 [Dendrobium nobile]|uniref:Uncharacterized protein n=1 Tax=Dendrobium nobile TaxID=94219 RepID=A0A8T3AGV3_DENNO|nr:hypothetical protein KFK09_021750 [Dendrobium nobile]
MQFHLSSLKTQKNVVTGQSPSLGSHTHTHPYPMGMGGYEYDDMLMPLWVVMGGRCIDCTRRFFGSFLAIRLRSFYDFPFLSDRKLRHFDRKQEQELASCEGDFPPFARFFG